MCVTEYMAMYRTPCVKVCVTEYIAVCSTPCIKVCDEDHVCPADSRGMHRTPASWSWLQAWWSKPGKLQVARWVSPPTQFTRSMKMGPSPAPNSPPVTANARELKKQGSGWGVST